MALPSQAQSLTYVSITPHAPAAAAFALAGLLARDVGGRQKAAATAQQLHYAVLWQAAEAARAAAAAPARPPLLAAALKARRAVAVVQRGGMEAAAARLLQALQGGGSNGLRSATSWQLPAEAAALALPSSAAPASKQAAAAAGLHGMLKAAASEQLIAGDAAVMYGSGAAASASRQFGAAVHGAAVYAPVLLPTSAAAGSGAHAGGPTAAAAPGSVLITGGLGGLGMLSAAWLLRQRGDARLVLLGRSGRSSGDAATLTAGGWVSMARADVATTEEAAAAVALATREQRLGAMLHAGGVLADALLLNQTPAKLRAVAAPKLGGLRRLAGAGARQPLAQLLLFSSIAGELGTAGQGGYAAANAALDATAAVLQRQGCSGASVQWGAWAGAGMAAAEPQLLQKLQRQGYSAVQPAAGLAALHALLLGSEVAAVTMAAPYEWARFLASPARRQQPFFAAVLPPAALEAQPAAQPTAAQLSPQQRAAPAAAVVTPAALLPAIQQLLGDLIGGAAAEAGPEVPFLEAGLDSIGAVELRCGLERGVWPPAVHGLLACACSLGCASCRG